MLRAVTQCECYPISTLTIPTDSQEWLPVRGAFIFACDGSVWFVDSTGQLTEYARIRGNSTISGLRVDRKGVLYVATIQGTVYRIDPNKSGRILAQLDGSLTGGGTFLSDLAIGTRDELFVSNFPSNTGGIFKVRSHR